LTFFFFFPWSPRGFQSTTPPFFGQGRTFLFSFPQLSSLPSPKISKEFKAPSCYPPLALPPPPPPPLPLGCVFDLATPSFPLSTSQAFRQPLLRSHLPAFRSGSLSQPFSSSLQLFPVSPPRCPRLSRVQQVTLFLGSQWSSVREFSPWLFSPHLRLLERFNPPLPRSRLRI